MVMKSTRTAVKLATRASTARAAAAPKVPAPSKPAKPVGPPTITTATVASKEVKRHSPRAAPTPAPANKQTRLIALLRSPKGATIEQMTQLTGWQAHTVRGSISGVLRKRLGLNVLSAVVLEGKARVYRIVEAVAA